MFSSVGVDPSGCFVSRNPSSSSGRWSTYAHSRVFVSYRTPSTHKRNPGAGSMVVLSSTSSSSYRMELSTPTINHWSSCCSSLWRVYCYPWTCRRCYPRRNNNPSPSWRSHRPTTYNPTCWSSWRNLIGCWMVCCRSRKPSQINLTTQTVSRSPSNH